MSVSPDEAKPAVSVLQDMAELSAAFGGAVDDPYAVYARLRATGPVMTGDMLAVFGMTSMASSATGRPVYSLFGYDDILGVLRDPATFTSSINAERMGFLFDDLMILGMDGIEHRFMRSVLQPSFAGTIVERWREEMIGPLLDTEFIAPLKPRMRCDLMADFAVGFPVRSVYRIIGLPDDPAAYEQFASWGVRILAAPTGDPVRDPEGALAIRNSAIEASKGMYDQLRPIIAERRAEGRVEGDDLISSLLRAQHDGRGLTDHEIACFLRTVLPASAESTTRTFGSLMTMLLQQPDWLEEVRRDRSLILGAIEEAVRLEPVISVIAREVQADVEVSGVKIAAGSAVLLAVGAAGRDPEVYPEPDRFDPRRKRRSPLGFGFGAHMCIGMAVAKAEMEAALNGLLDQMPRLRLDPDFPAPKLTGVLFRGPTVLHVRWD